MQTGRIRFVIQAGQETKKEKPSQRNGFCGPGGIRTPNLLIRSQVLYPVKLRDLLGFAKLSFSPSNSPNLSLKIIHLVVVFSCHSVRIKGRNDIFHAVPCNFIPA